MLFSICQGELNSPLNQHSCQTSTFSLEKNAVQFKNTGMKIPTTDEIAYLKMIRLENSGTV